MICLTAHVASQAKYRQRSRAGQDRTESVLTSEILRLADTKEPIDVA